MSEENDTLLITSTHGLENPEKAILPFVIGNGALAMDTDVVIFLLADAVELAVKGKAAEIKQLEALPDPQKVINDFFALGGKAYLCGPCSNHRKISNEDLVEGAEIGGAALLVNLASERPVISL